MKRAEETMRSVFNDTPPTENLSDEVARRYQDTYQQLYGTSPPQDLTFGASQADILSEVSMLRLRHCEIQCRRLAHRGLGSMSDLQSAERCEADVSSQRLLRLPNRNAHNLWPVLEASEDDERYLSPVKKRSYKHGVEEVVTRVLFIHNVSIG
jgi:hypothetical protein